MTAVDPWSRSSTENGHSANSLARKRMPAKSFSAPLCLLVRSRWKDLWPPCEHATVFFAVRAPRIAGGDSTRSSDLHPKPRMSAGDVDSSGKHAHDSQWLHRHFYRDFLPARDADENTSAYDTMGRCA